MEMLKNKYGKLSLSKVVPALWFVFLLYSLGFVYIDKEPPKIYYDLTMVFSSVYVGRTAIDKINDKNTDKTNP
jgi:hypothetical protein